jgi:hypothetical protein
MRTTDVIARMLAPLVSQPWFAPAVFIVCGAALTVKTVTRGASADSALGAAHEVASVLWEACSSLGLISAGVSAATSEPDSKEKE